MSNKPLPPVPPTPPVPSAVRAAYLTPKKGIQQKRNYHQTSSVKSVASTAAAAALRKTPQTPRNPNYYNRSKPVPPDPPPPMPPLPPLPEDLKAFPPLPVIRKLSIVDTPPWSAPRSLKMPIGGQKVRSLSFAAAKAATQGASAIPVSRKREASVDAATWQRQRPQPRPEETDQIDYASLRIQSTVKNKGVPIPEGMADSRWWCGRIMAVTDRLRLEMLRAPQTERDNKAFKELFDLCPDQDTIEILKSMWAVYTRKRVEERAGLKSP